jgi:hypothetical protein
LVALGGSWMPAPSYVVVREWALVASFLILR